MSDITDSELTEYIGGGPCNPECASCRIAAEAQRRRPSIAERVQLADVLPALEAYPAAFDFVVRQLTRAP